MSSWRVVALLVMAQMGWVASSLAGDCNDNGVDDAEEIANGAEDANHDGLLDI